MDNLFQDNTLEPKTKIKQKFDDSFIFLSRIVRRYYRNFVSNKVQKNKKATEISWKMKTFRKGRAQKKVRRILESYLPNLREERVNSNVIRPNLINLGDLLPAEEEEEFEEETFYNRLRANTKA